MLHEVPTKLELLLELSPYHHGIRKVRAKTEDDYPEVYCKLQEIDALLVQIREMLGYSRSDLLRGNKVPTVTHSGDTSADKLSGNNLASTRQAHAQRRFLSAICNDSDGAA